MKEIYEPINFIESENIYNFQEDGTDFLDNFLDKFSQDKIKTVCFTGSRPASLPWGYNEECELFKVFYERLKVLINALYDRGFVRFISGMALGFDTYVAECVLEKKKEGKPVFLECAIPCETQSARWSGEQKARYNNILSHADKITYVSQNFDMGCYARRNEYMVKNASLVVALRLKQDGGTASTIKLAKKFGRPIIMFK